MIKGVLQESNFIKKLFVKLICVGAAKYGNDITYWYPVPCHSVHSKCKKCCYDLSNC